MGSVSVKNSGLKIAILGTTLAIMPGAHGADLAEGSNVTARASVTLDLGSKRVFADKFRPGMRTSDAFASEWWCGADPSHQDFCEVEDQHRYTPKNIGNNLCLPMGQGNYRIEEACAALLDAGKDQDCQRNSYRPDRETCPGAPTVRPHCNYRTEKTGEVAWRWIVSEVEGELVIGCSQEGYTGFTPGGSDEEVAEPIATGCLGRGRLRALDLGDAPLRPCRRGETEITIPAAEAD